MDIAQIKEKLSGDEYGFLNTDPKLGDNIILMGLSGSHAYGTANQDSDVDIRGCALNSADEILTGEYFEQAEDTATDTVIYSLKKLMRLLAACNPNTIEILGLKPEHYLRLTPEGRLLLDNRHIFLSKLAVNTFGSFAGAQLRRLDNKSARTLKQTEHEKHILNSIKSAAITFPQKYFDFPSDALRLYVDDAVSDDMDSEIFMDISLTKYPLRDYKGMMAEMSNILKDYAKIGKRNRNAMEHDKISKHMMHLMRLYLMSFDILEKGEIITYRQDDRDLLLHIRNGGFLGEDGQPVPEFFKMADEYEAKLKRLAAASTLPEKPDYTAINKLLAEINRRVIVDS